MTIFLIAAAVATTCPPSDLRAELLASHEAARTGHLKGDAEMMAEGADERVTMADGGSIRVQTRDELRRFFEGYFKRVRYREWSDEAPPAVAISPDGQIGWMAVAVRARYFRPEEPGAEKSFKSSWIATYRRDDCRWKMTGIASNVVQ